MNAHLVHHLFGGIPQEDTRDRDEHQRGHPEDQAVGKAAGGLLLLLVTYLTVSVADRRIRGRRGSLRPRIVGPVPPSTS